MINQGCIGMLNSIIYDDDDELNDIILTLNELNIAYEIGDTEGGYYCKSLVLKNDPNMNFPSICGMIIGLPSWIFEWDHKVIESFIDSLFIDNEYICNDKLGHDIMKIMDLISIEYEYRHMNDDIITITKN